MLSTGMGLLRRLRLDAKNSCADPVATDCYASMTWYSGTGSPPSWKDLSKKELPGEAPNLLAAQN